MKQHECFVFRSSFKSPTGEKINVISFIVVLFDGLVKSNIVQFSIFTSKVVSNPLKISPILALPSIVT